MVSVFFATMIYWHFLHNTIFLNWTKLSVIPPLSAPYQSLKPRPHGLGFFHFQGAKFGGIRNVAHGYFVNL